MAHALQITSTGKDFDGRAFSSTTLILADQIASVVYHPATSKGPELEILMKSGLHHQFTKLSRKQTDDIYALVMDSLQDLNYKTNDLEINLGF